MSMGGFTLYIILACSIISLAIIIDRFRAFKKAGKVERKPFMAKLASLLPNKENAELLKFTKENDSPIAHVAEAGLQFMGYDEKSITQAMDRAITEEIGLIEKWTNIVGTIGGTAVYIGLFGTVLGIIRAFQEISMAAATGGGMSAVITGIAEALICTASGIFVAVPSVIAYNLMLKKVDDIQAELELTASETADLIRRVHGSK